MSKEFGQRLGSLRKLTGLNQQDFQKACGWGDGTNNSRISMYEIGKNEPTLADIEIMAAVLKVSPAHLAFGAPDTLDPRESEIIRKYRVTDDRGRDEIVSAAQRQPDCTHATKKARSPTPPETTA